MELDVLIQRFNWSGGHRAIGSTVQEIARTAESVGVRSIQFMDHFLQADMFGGVESPMLEGYTTLGYVAGITERLRLRLLVTGVTYRNPGVLAKIVSTLDVLSAGRGELGIGAAWYEREHGALGLPFPSLADRFEMLEETLQICRQFWGPDDGPYQGKHFRLQETISAPPPVSDPRPRVTIGGAGEKRTLRIGAMYADACNIPVAAGMMAPKLDALRQHCEASGRDPAKIEISTTLAIGRNGIDSADDALREAERYAALGVSVCSAPIPEQGDPAGWLERVWGPVTGRLSDIEPGRWY